MKRSIAILMITILASCDKKVSKTESTALESDGATIESIHSRTSQNRKDHAISIAAIKSSAIGTMKQVYERGDSINHCKNTWKSEFSALTDVFKESSGRDYVLQLIDHVEPRPHELQGEVDAALASKYNGLIVTPADLELSYMYYLSLIHSIDNQNNTELVALIAGALDNENDRANPIKILSAYAALQHGSSLLKPSGYGVLLRDDFQALFESPSADARLLAALLVPKLYDKGDANVSMESTSHAKVINERHYAMWIGMLNDSDEAVVRYVSKRLSGTAKTSESFITAMKESQGFKNAPHYEIIRELMFP
jgi:hypothetical protein